MKGPCALRNITREKWVSPSWVAKPWTSAAEAPCLLVPVWTSSSAGVAALQILGGKKLSRASPKPARPALKYCLESSGMCRTLNLPQWKFQLLPRTGSLHHCQLQIPCKLLRETSPVDCSQAGWSLPPDPGALGLGMQWPWDTLP